MKNYELYILEKLREFKKLEQAFTKYTYQAKKPKNIGDSAEYFRKAAMLSMEAVELKNTILGEMHNVKEIQLKDTEAKNTLDRLINKKRFASTAFAETTAELFKLDIDQSLDTIEMNLETYISGEKHDELWKDFFSWFFISEYYFRMIQLETINLSNNTSDTLGKYYQEIKKAYVLGLDKSCIALSRDLLEIALRDRLQKKRAFKEGYITTINVAVEDPLERYITVGFKLGLLTKHDTDLAHQVRKNAKNILHIDDNDNFSVRGLALKTISDTVKIIEQLQR